MNTGGHKVMVHVAQNANDLGGESVVQDLDGLILVALVSLGHRAVFNLASRANANAFQIACKCRHNCSFYLRAVLVGIANTEPERRPASITLLRGPYIGQAATSYNAKFIGSNSCVHLGVRKNPVS